MADDPRDADFAEAIARRVVELLGEAHQHPPLPWLMSVTELSIE